MTAEKYRQVVMTVSVSVADTAAVENHRLIQKRFTIQLSFIQLSKKILQSVNIELINLFQIFNPAFIISVVT